jgi:hypothetical protein
VNTPPRQYTKFECHLFRTHPLTGHLIEHLESDAEMMSFRAVIPPMLDALRQMMTGDDEDAVNSAFEVPSWRKKKR